MKKALKFEVVGSKIEIIGGSIYPKEESWSPLCPYCSKPLKIRLYWDQEACEFSLSIDCVETVNSKSHIDRSE